jgi:hypothetical protein
MYKKLIHTHRRKNREKCMPLFTALAITGSRHVLVPSNDPIHTFIFNPSGN